MDRSSRSLLRRIAMGLPLAAAPFGGLLLSGFTGCGPCGGEPEIVTMHTISAAQHDRLVSGPGTIDPASCAALCMELRSDAGVVSDGALRDAGAVVNDGSWRCTVDRVEPDEILTCTSGGRAFGCVGGRRPQAFRGAAAAGSEIGGWLAELARLESASIPAFEELAAELALHRAPRALSRAARASADDERRHARAVRALAERWGAEPRPVTRGETGVRSFSAMADDNAVEGCVREAFGALVAAHQASAALDPIVAEAFATIARDEARHALLSFALHDWASERLGARHARRTGELRREELTRLALEAAEPSAACRRVLGLPDATRAADMLALLAA